METLIEQIKAALANDATSETRITGANACRAILTALEATDGSRFAASNGGASPPLQQRQISPAAIQAAVTALRGVPLEQILDVAIARLRAALPAGSEVAPIKTPTFQLVPVPKIAR